MDDHSDRDAARSQIVPRSRCRAVLGPLAGRVRRKDHLRRQLAGGHTDRSPLGLRASPDRRFGGGDLVEPGASFDITYRADCVEGARVGSMTDISVQIQVERRAFSLASTFEVAAGETVALLGPNGAGKSTLVEALAGLVPIRAGMVRVGDVVWDEPDQGIRLVPQQRSVGVMFQGLR